MNPFAFLAGWQRLFWKRVEIRDEALRGLQLTQTQAALDLVVGLFTERNQPSLPAPGILK